MRVLHVIPSISPCRGGASKAAIDMVAALNAQGVNAEIACTNDHGPEVLDVPLGRLVDYAGVPVRFFARRSSRWDPIQEFAYSAALRQWLKDNLQSYDVVHVHALFSFASTYTMWLAKKRKIHYVAHPIGSLESWSLQQSALRKKVYLELFEKDNLRQASRVHFTAVSEQNQALKIVPHIRPAVIPLGLSLPELPANAAQILKQKYGLSTNSKVLLFLGRLHPKKGLEIILESMGKLSNDVHLLIAGDGDAHYIAKLKAKIQQHSLQDRVTLMGYLDGSEKTLALSGADLFILVSYSENFGVAVLESLAHGTSVLVSEGVALSAQVAEHDLGSVCSMEVDDVATSLQSLLANKSQLHALGEQGRAYVARYHDWNTLAMQLIALYKTILKPVH